MALIRPFQGVRFDPTRVTIGEVVTPPYDVISSEQQEQFYSRSKHNIVRLILGKQHASDTHEENRYTRARRHLEDWLREGTLIQDSKESLYIYEQKFNETVRRGFIARMEIEDFSKGTVVPHERTLSGPKADRLELMRATEANFGLIFLLYSDPEGTIDRVLERHAEAAPVYEFAFEDGIRNRLWVLHDPESVEAIVNAMKEKTVYIADGHHRYETRLAYSSEAGNMKDSANYGMMAFYNMDNPGLRIYPTHRLIRGLEDFGPGEFVKRLEEFFTIQTVHDTSEFLSLLKSRGKHCFGLYWPSNPVLFTLKEEQLAIREGDASRSDDWNLLDVSILHSLVIEKLLGIENVEEHVRYTRIDDEAIRKVDAGEYQIALFLNATSIEEFKTIAANRERMPQKSTYFFPKLMSGLVLYKF